MSRPVSSGGDLHTPADAILAFSSTLFRCSFLEAGRQGCG